MKTYEIDTRCLEAKKGITVIRMISDLAVYLADQDKNIEYTCAFNDLPKETQDYYEGMARFILGKINDEVRD